MENTGTRVKTYRSHAWGRDRLGGRARKLHGSREISSARRNTGYSRAGSSGIPEETPAHPTGSPEEKPTTSESPSAVPELSSSTSVSVLGG